MSTISTMTDFTTFCVGHQAHKTAPTKSPRNTWITPQTPCTISPSNYRSHSNNLWRIDSKCQSPHIPSLYMAHIHFTRRNTMPTSALNLSTTLPTPHQHQQPDGPICAPKSKASAAESEPHTTSSPTQAPTTNTGSTQFVTHFI